MDNLVNLLGADKESEDYIYCINNKLEDNININIDDLDKTTEKNISEIKNDKNEKKRKSKKEI